MKLWTLRVFCDLFKWSACVKTQNTYNTQEFGISFIAILSPQHHTPAFVTLHSIWRACRLEMCRCCHIQWGLSTPIISDQGWSISIKLHKSTLKCSFPTAGVILAPPKRKKEIKKRTMERGWKWKSLWNSIIWLLIQHTYNITRTKDIHADHY